MSLGSEKSLLGVEEVISGGLYASLEPNRFPVRVDGLNGELITLFNLGFGCGISVNVDVAAGGLYDSIATGLSGFNVRLGGIELELACLEGELLILFTLGLEFGIIG